MYNRWTVLLPDVELYLVHLPGRDHRIKEPLQERLSTLVEQLTGGLLPHLDVPFAFFGHSMGGLISFEVARQLRRQQAPQPARLFISARRAPQRPDPHAHLYQLPDAELLRAAEYLYGALPEAVRQDAEVLKLFLSIMRADFTMLGTYRYVDEPPLEYPISAFGGLQDRSVTGDELSAWKDQTASSFHLEMFPSDHFFIQDSRESLLQHLTRDLSPS
jgi:medium-chain acyl-[acyl-carrier-protein] hydrolase